MKKQLSILVVIAGLMLFSQDIVAQSASKKAPRDSNAEAIKKLQSEVFLLRYELNKFKSSTATIRTDSQDYDIARTKYGPFIISQRGLTEFLDGYKLKLAIGNTTSVTFSGAKLTLEWGPPYDEKNFSKWLDARKKKEVQLTDSFHPGTYTIIEVVISPAKPEEAKEIEVGIEFNQVSLR